MSVERSTRIVIPAHNEEARIAATLRAYCEHFEADAVICVVANGCSDSTCDVVSKLQATYSNLELINIEGSIGKGGAVRAGLKAAVEDYVGFIDADMSTRPEEFRRLLGILRLRQLDGVIGSRWLRGSVVKPRQPIMRRIASRVFNGMVRVVLGLKYSDTQCGAKVFRRAALERVFYELALSNFAFDIDLLHQLDKCGFRVEELPTVWSNEAVGSKVKLAATSLSMFRALVWLRFRDSLIGQIPYFQLLVRDDILRVRDSLSILILSDSGDGAHPNVKNKFLAQCVRDWAARGNDVTIVSGRCPVASDVRLDNVNPILKLSRLFSDAIDRLRILIWYTFVSGRRYDVIIECASRAPYVIPALSVKSRYLFVEDQQLTTAGFCKNFIYAKFYTGAAKLICNGGLELRLENSQTQLDASSLLDVLRGDSSANGFFALSERGWALHVVDRTGASQRHILKR